MSHDLIAELDGYRNELASAERYGKNERAAAVQEQIDRVTGEISTAADKFDAEADGHIENREDLAAAQARIRARQLRQALDVPGGENAAESRPRQTAVAKRPKGGN